MRETDTRHRALAGQIACCTACPLAAGRTTVVVGSGPVPAPLLVLGEGPGAQEDATGRPFVGRAGQLLDRLLVAAGMPRERVAVSNVVKCRPPGNRPPTRAEVVTCRGWLAAQILLIDPEVIVTLGGTATGWALGRGLRLAEAVREAFEIPAGGLRIEGRVGDARIPNGQISFELYKGSQFEPGDKRPHLVEGRSILPTYHPSAALRGGPQGATVAHLRADLALAVGLLR